MSKSTWIGLTARERILMLDALAAFRRSKGPKRKDIDALTVKLIHSAPYPDITVGVEGGQVQWALGNPFPIRVCDYDGASDEDLPDIDGRGQRCRMWSEPPKKGAKAFPRCAFHNPCLQISREPLTIIRRGK